MLNGMNAPAVMLQLLPSGCENTPMDDAFALAAKHNAMTSETIKRTFIFPPQRMSTDAAVLHDVFTGCTSNLLDAPNRPQSPSIEPELRTIRTSPGQVPENLAPRSVYVLAVPCFQRVFRSRLG